jgi:uroporphyrinogen-III synthase
MDKYVWITRPHPQAEVTARELAQFGIASIISPAITLNETPDAARLCAEITADTPLIITSQMALHIMARYTPHRSLPLYVTGAALRQLAKEYGFEDVTAGQGDAASILPLLKERNYDYLHGNHTAFDMKGALHSRGICCTSREIYRSDYAITLTDTLLETLKNQELAAITCYSLFTAEALCHLLEQYGMLTYAKTLPVYCISEAIASYLRKVGFRTIIVALPKVLASQLATL